MNPPQPIPNWQIERANILHRACLSFQAALDAGKPILRSCRRIARRYHLRRCKSNPVHRILLSPQSLRRHWAFWVSQGKTPGVFFIKWGRHYSRISPEFMARFIRFCAAKPYSSVKSAWLVFRALNYAEARKISIDQVYYHFSAADFYRLQALLKTASDTSAEAEAICARAVAQIRERIPKSQR